MKIEIDSTPRVDDKDSAAKCERVGGLRLESEKQALGSISNNQKGFRFLAEEVLKDNATTDRSRALQQAVCHGVWQAQSCFLQRRQQTQPQHAAVVSWEKFLPQQRLQVLLVEDDDATRHVVSALLRNCSYEVKPASNGLVAWELLMDQNNRVDLVLTEVAMPCLSGIGLLGRIMTHEALKHIPVIMMSSHDSMNVVFKCLSKGAVDFLVKPVRKNELKNLWQHVWRRCHSSSGSRSGSGSHTQKTARSNHTTNVNESGTTNGDSDKTSSELNVRGGSDNGSGTQSPWIKGGLEVESCHPINKLHSTGFRTSSRLHPVSKLEDISLVGPEHCTERGDDSQVGTTSTTVAANAAHLNLVASTYKIPEAAVDDHLASCNGNACDFPPGIAVDLVGIIKEQDSNEEGEEVSEDEDDFLEKHASNSPSAKDKLFDSSSPPPLNSSNIVTFSSKQPCKEEDHVREKGARGGVIHSSASAFSRYNSRGNFTPLIARNNPVNSHAVPVGFGSGMPAQEGGNGSRHTLSSIFTLQKESIAFPNSGSDEATAGSFLANNTEVECLAQMCPPAKHGVLSKKDTSLPYVPGSFPASKQAGTSHVVHAGAGLQVGESGDAKDYKEDEFVYSHTDNYSQYHRHRHHHHHHHIQHHYYHVADSTQPNDQTVTDVGDGAPKCGSSNMANCLEGNVGLSGSSNGYGSNGNAAMSVNGSASGSNNGSNGVQSAAAVLPIRESKDVNDQNGFLDMTGLNEDCFADMTGLNARREAALTKFRQKRKERCFEKKVRYQSRKRLAEQRPRVRGQFVKQVTTLEEPEPIERERVGTTRHREGLVFQNNNCI